MEYDDKSMITLHKYFCKGKQHIHHETRREETFVDRKNEQRHFYISENRFLHPALTIDYTFDCYMSKEVITQYTTSVSKRTEERFRCILLARTVL